ncbi:MAG: hypothetical protein KDC92_15880 [Bacteroidetes bacterium]|nr:hypothetical protein [Bacteroidota bacterium]
MKFYFLLFVVAILSFTPRQQQAFNFESNCDCDSVCKNSNYHIIGNYCEIQSTKCKDIDSFAQAANGYKLLVAIHKPKTRIGDVNGISVYKEKASLCQIKLQSALKKDSLYLITIDMAKPNHARLRRPMIKFSFSPAKTLNEFYSETVREAGSNKNGSTTVDLTENFNWEGWRKLTYYFTAKGGEKFINICPNFPLTENDEIEFKSYYDNLTIEPYK